MPEIEVGQRARLTRHIEGYGDRGDRVVIVSIRPFEYPFPVSVYRMDDGPKWDFGVRWDEIEVINGD